jgi:hypothetical protein
MMFGKKQPSQVFSVPKVHTRKKRVWLAIEIIIVLAVLVGTIFTFLWSSNFSTQKVLDNLKEFLSLKKQNEVAKGVSFEEQVRSSIDGKIIKISSLEKSPEGFLVIRDKDGLTVVLSPEKDLETQVRTLQTLLGKAKIEKRAVSLVDFRFEKLVVRYK